ncbi:MAG: hypothetical protein M1836_003949 [Candelina mexicana]|nr:MAG: hypothetical protein M1836_003949 [Candelina mexicana]
MPAVLSDPAPVPDTPVQRSQSAYHQYQHNSGYYSLSGSDDEHEAPTILERMPYRRPASYVTQPTQIIDKPAQKAQSSQRPSPVVQVPASSPLQSPAPKMTQKSNILRPGGLLANALAPLGTTFRAPLLAQKVPLKAPIIDLSDDEPKYRGEASSDDDEISITKVVDIVPTAFAKGGHTYPGGDGVTDGANPTSSKRSANTMGSALDTSSRVFKKSRQSAPLRAQPVEEDLQLDSIPDFNLRSKIQRIIDVFPSTTVRVCQTALNACKGNTEDAMAAISDKQSARIPYNNTEHASTQSNPGSPVRRRVMAPSQSIHDKWGAKALVHEKTLTKSPQNFVNTKAPVKRRKLVQGRKPQSSPTDESLKAPSPPIDGSDEDVDSDRTSEAKQDSRTELRLLQFFNTCSKKDLQDFANTDDQTAQLILSSRPFDDIQAVKSIKDVSTTKAVNSDGKERIRRAVGDKIVEICLETWTGFEAIDALVTQCEELGKPVAEGLEAWGVDIFGVPKASNLDMVPLELRPKKENLGTQTETNESEGVPSGSALASEAEHYSEDAQVTRQHRLSGDLRAPVAQPALMARDFVLKDYQIVGLNWLALLFQRNLSCILADEMGLGKTCQVIAFLAYLQETSVKGPHLVVVPGSTLENWLREFSVFCPGLIVEPYYGSDAARAPIRTEIMSNREAINVVITTYDVAVQSKDKRFLRKDLKPVVCVYDEAHVLRNSETQKYQALAAIPAQFRILLTGTPLQNNLRELASLLAFIMPSLFETHKDDLQTIFKYKAKTTNSTHAALLSRQRITRAKAMLKPFILRRKKYQVLKDLPKKINRVQYCELHQSQSDLYNAEVEHARHIVEHRAAGDIADEVTTNVLMQLRKASIHPLLFRRIFDDQKISAISKDLVNNKKWRPKIKRWRNLKADELCDEFSYLSDFELHTLCEENLELLSKYNLEEDEWMDSGKVGQLVELLLAYKANGDRVLVFSQFVIVLDILEAVMETLRMQYSRLDGSTKVNERQDLIDQFDSDTSITVFLLSTGAGGAGINLAAANKVVIFDASFNPQQDVQAENRAHRLGQKRDVEVIRLVTRGTVEEDILSLGEAKLSLDRRVAGDEGLEDDEEKVEAQVKKLLDEAMWKRIQGEPPTLAQDSVGCA